MEGTGEHAIPRHTRPTYRIPKGLLHDVFLVAYDILRWNVAFERREHCGSVTNRKLVAWRKLLHVPSRRVKARANTKQGNFSNSRNL